MVKVTFLPANKIGEVPAGSTIFQSALAAGVQIESTCGGRGTCGKCKVQIPPEIVDPSDDPTEKFISSVEQAVGWVLACKHKVLNNLTVKLSEQKDVHIRKTGLNRVENIKIDPIVQKCQVHLSEPTVTDQTPDWERIVAAMPNHEIRFNRRIAADLAQILRRAEFNVTAVLSGNDLLAVEQGDTCGRCYGLAIDIGTTTVVVYLTDLTTGKVIGSGAVTNPQNVFGADVISRITYAAGGSDQLRQLQTNVINGLNGIIATLCGETGISNDEIYQAVVVGNTTMSHLFLGIDPTYLASSPFIPVFRQCIEVEANELGLNILATGHVVVLPNVAGYVGADTVGVMLAAEVDRLPGITLAIDIGTNGEMIMAGQNRILTCSTAAGPAFEGAEIKCGMRAAEGAIEEVRIGEDVELGVIAGKKAKGICGSGLIDAIAEMYRAGVIEASGRLVSETDQLDKLSPAVRKRIRRDEHGSEFVLVWRDDSATGEDIVLSQKDIRELQLAKGAIKAGVQILLREMGVSAEAIDRVLLSGAFGSYIKKESAVGIGLLPDLPLEKIETIGNAAGDGAIMALLSKEERARSESLAAKAEHIELSTRKEFQEEFVMALTL